MKLKKSSIYILLLLVQSCKLDSSISDKNELSRLTRIVDNSFRKSNAGALKLISSSEVQNDLDIFDKIVATQSISKTDTSCQTLYEKISVNEEMQFIDSIKGRYRYTFVPTAKARECYTKLYIRPDVNKNNSWMVFCCFYKRK